MTFDAELDVSIRSAAKTEIRRRVWANNRGKATRAYLRAHPEVAVEFETTSTISATSFPAHVTRASVLLELRMRATRRETAKAVRQWREEHPEEARRIQEEVASERS